MKKVYFWERIVYFRELLYNILTIKYKEKEYEKQRGNYFANKKLFRQ